MRYRCRTEIIAIMLNSMTGGTVTKSKIMYKAYLSYSQLMEYLSFLLEQDFISYEKRTKRYGITETGRKFLDKYDEIADSISLKPKMELPEIVI